jgi:hypothetical protein
MFGDHLAIETSLPVSPMPKECLGVGSDELLRFVQEVSSQSISPTKKMMSATVQNGLHIRPTILELMDSDTLVLTVLDQIDIPRF